MTEPGEAVRENYRKQGAEAREKEILAFIKGAICFNHYKHGCDHGGCRALAELERLIKPWGFYKSSPESSTTSTVSEADE